MRDNLEAIRRALKQGRPLTGTQCRDVCKVIEERFRTEGLGLPEASVEKLRRSKRRPQRLPKV